ncbi:hypothetical protein D6D20_09311 [Aureobasidium pullulans]|uniref:C2H2-type domain-containing protein n=1 Tax=Aureobasidium pullulans TaxID=5580 RepID=A0A4S8YSM6_AURPU|nr:hypothetical protein D6D20_09311 [Aureobasidium pullulans]
MVKAWSCTTPALQATSWIVELSDARIPAADTELPLTHSGERRYTCRLCGRAWSRAWGLRRHYRDVHGLDTRNAPSHCVNVPLATRPEEVAETEPVIVPGITPNGNPGASLRPLPRPLPPSSPPPFMDISPLGILGSIMWHTRAERHRSSVESYRSLNELVTARLNRFLIEEDEYPKRYNIWQQHNVEVDTLKDAMLDDTAAAECQRKLPAALKLEAESRRKFVDSARACFHFIKELEYSQNRSFELDEESLDGMRVNKELVQDLWSSFAEATSTPSWLLSMYQYI